MRRHCHYLSIVASLPWHSMGVGSVINSCTPCNLPGALSLGAEVLPRHCGFEGSGQRRTGPSTLSAGQLCDAPDSKPETLM